MFDEAGQVYVPFRQASTLMGAQGDVDLKQSRDRDQLIPRTSPTSRRVTRGWLSRTELGNTGIPVSLSPRAALLQGERVCPSRDSLKAQVIALVSNEEFLN